MTEILHETAIVTQVDPYTLQGKFLPVPPKLEHYSATNIGQIVIHLYILETCKHYLTTVQLSVINDLL